jgi:hypothetical protein
MSKVARNLQMKRFHAISHLFSLDPFVGDIYLSVEMVFGVGCKCVSGI